MDESRFVLINTTGNDSVIYNVKQLYNFISIPSELDVEKNQITSATMVRHNKKALLLMVSRTELLFQNIFQKFYTVICNCSFSSTFSFNLASCRRYHCMPYMIYPIRIRNCLTCYQASIWNFGLLWSSPKQNAQMGHQFMGLTKTWINLKGILNPKFSCCMATINASKIHLEG